MGITCFPFDYDQVRKHASQTITGVVRSVNLKKNGSRDESLSEQIQGPLIIWKNSSLIDHVFMGVVLLTTLGQLWTGEAI